jgi:hypothetical protein
MSQLNTKQPTSIEEAAIAYLSVGDCKVFQQEIDIFIAGAKHQEEQDKNLREAVSKFINHWEIYFSSPRVGQPPAIQDLRDALIFKQENK